MGGADYTRVVFHNGKLMESTFREREDGIYKEILPFEYTRLGRLKNKHDYIYVEDEIHYSDKLYYHLRDPFAELFCLETDEYNVIFYIGDENYVMLGGYGHFDNPYTHFYDRGLSEKIECILMGECYEWLMGDVLDDIVGTFFDYYEHKDILKSYYKIFNYVPVLERDKYESWKPIEVEK